MSLSIEFIRVIETDGGKDHIEAEYKVLYQDRTIYLRLEVPRSPNEPFIADHTQPELFFKGKGRRQGFDLVSSAFCTKGKELMKPGTYSISGSYTIKTKKVIWNLHLEFQWLN